MGRALVIKGADFSLVKIEDISIDGRKYFSQNNPLLIKNGYFRSSTHDWVENAQTDCYFWSVSEGDYVVSKGSIPTMNATANFGFATIENGTPVFISTLLSRVSDNVFIIGKVPADCYLYTVIKDGENIVPLPQDNFIASEMDAELLNSLQIRFDNYLYEVNGYETTSGGWGSGATTRFYPVLKDEVLKVTALANHNSNIGFVGNSLKNTNGAVIRSQANMNKITTDEYRISVPMGTSQEITMPNNGYVAILATDSGTNVFPASVEITIV